jgi:hypothetical protein
MQYLFRIPLDIFDLAEELKLKPNELIVYMYLCRCNNSNDFIIIFPSQKKISEKTGMSKISVIRSLKVLISKNLITELTDLEKSNIICKSRIFDLDADCEWCFKKTDYLHKHHYPIKKSDGGIDTVNICSECHSKFHTRMFNLNKNIFKSKGNCDG